jgi:hypothetical protein
MSLVVQNELQRGHAIMDSIRAHFEILDQILPRSAEQIDVHDAMTAASVGIVYGEAMSTHEIEVIRYNNFNDTLNKLLLSAPRRLGKTFAIAMAIAVFFLCIPNVKFVIVSQAKRSAGADVGILATVKKMLWDVFGYKDFDRSNSEQITGKFGEGDERRISSYSAGSGDAYGKFFCYLWKGGIGMRRTAPITVEMTPTNTLFFLTKLKCRPRGRKRTSTNSSNCVLRHHTLFLIQTGKQSPMPLTGAARHASRCIGDVGVKMRPRDINTGRMKTRKNCGG